MFICVTLIVTEINKLWKKLYQNHKPWFENGIWINIQSCQDFDTIFDVIVESGTQEKN